jgi:uncharacterized protein (DUF1330 family)
MPSAGTSLWEIDFLPSLTSINIQSDCSPRCGDCSLLPTEESAMNPRIAMGLTLLTGIAIGATTIQGLHAQAKPPTYVVVAIRKINDAAAYKADVVDKAGAVIAAAGGHFLVRTDQITSFDGPPPVRFVLLGFDSPEKAQAWHNSQAMKDIDAARAKSTDSLSFMVEGAQ